MYLIGHHRASREDIVPSCSQLLRCVLRFVGDAALSKAKTLRTLANSIGDRSAVHSAGHERQLRRHLTGLRRRADNATKKSILLIYIEIITNITIMSNAVVITISLSRIAISIRSLLGSSSCIGVGISAGATTEPVRRGTFNPYGHGKTGAHDHRHCNFRDHLHL